MVQLKRNAASLVSLRAKACGVYIKMFFVLTTFGHFTFVCLVTWPMNVNEAGVALALNLSAFVI